MRPLKDYLNCQSEHSACKGDTVQQVMAFNVYFSIKYSYCATFSPNCSPKFVFGKYSVCKAALKTVYFLHVASSLSRKKLTF